LRRLFEKLFLTIPFFFRYLITNNVSNIIKAIRLLQDAGKDNIPEDSDASSEDEDDDNVPRDSLGLDDVQQGEELDNAVQREQEEFDIREAELQAELETMGKKRGKCFRLVFV
jgi:hypothetical protein